MRKHIVPHCDILAYCLMPNHFHILIYANSITVKEAKIGQIVMSPFSIGLKNLLSGYAKGINKQERRTGSIFTKNTKCKPVQDFTHNTDYSTICFNYIHRNPLKAKMIKKLDDWPYSSFHEYIKHHYYGLCNIALAKKLIDLDWDHFYQISHLNESGDIDYSKIF